MTTVPPCAEDGRNPEDWFPAVESSSARSQPTAAERRALAVCATCPAELRAVCLADALTAGETRQHGVAGGMRAADRRALLYRRKRKGAAA